MTVWRLHIKPGKTEDSAFRHKILEYCMQNDIIGIGWEVENRDSVISMAKTEFSNKYPGESFSSIHAMSKMKADDLIWTRLDGVYYLCRVKEPLWLENVFPNDHKKVGVYNYVGAEWHKVGTEDTVPGKVISSFRATRTVQAVGHVEEISKLIYNKMTGPDYDSIDESKIDFWNVISDKDVEDIVLLYLQCQGFLVYTKTLKSNTSKYECVLVKKDTKERAVVQVKSGGTSIEEESFYEFANHDYLVYLFSHNETPSAKPGIEVLTKKMLEDFITNDENKDILPDVIVNCLSYIARRENPHG